MLRLIRPAAIILLVVAISLSAAASANSLFKKGKDAEARQNYEQAYEYYKQAYDLKPKDLAYRAAYESRSNSASVQASNTRSASVSATHFAP